MSRAVILLVDDEPEIRECAKTFLEIEGYDVITAANGLDGLQQYKDHKDEVEVVVTDLDMPAMTGSEMIRQISKISPAIKVIVASGRSLSYVHRNKRHRDTTCLQKPYTSGELTAAVRLLL